MKTPQTSTVARFFAKEWHQALPWCQKGSAPGCHLSRWSSAWRVGGTADVARLQASPVFQAQAKMAAERAKGLKSGRPHCAAAAAALKR